MQFLVSFCNSAAPSDPVLAVVDGQRLQLSSVVSSADVLGCSGITGLSVSDRFVYAAAQGINSLLLLDRTTLGVVNQYRFQHAVDVHSIRVVDDILYAVSSGTDEVVALQLHDDQIAWEHVYWRVDPNGPRADRHHLNAVWAEDARLLVAGFGPKQGESWSSATDGFIVDIHTNERVATDIAHPHSVMVIDNQLAFCESRRMAVRSLEAGHERRLPGYSRGLCVIGSSIFVATSLGRQASRRRGMVENPHESAGNIRGRCTISRLSRRSFQVEDILELSHMAREIYDLAPTMAIPYTSTRGIQRTNDAGSGVPRGGVATSDRSTVFEPFSYPIALEHPLRLAPSGWLLHVPFGMALIDIVQPRVLVELGTHHGVSYCAFCQAVQTLGTDTTCVAVDTWQGDAQAGFYGPEVLADLKAHHDPLYSDFSTLMHSSFDDAAAHFDDDSIDLLHIDGLHTYDAVKHDFEHWLPKLSQRGVVLFHDITERQGDFGVWRLWEELSRRYPSFALEHGHGLGLILVGDESPGSLALLLDATDDERDQIARYFRRIAERLQLQFQIDEATRSLATQRAANANAIAAKDRELTAKDGALAAKDQELAAKDQALAIRDEAVEAKDRELARRDQAIAAQTERVAALVAQVTRLEAQWANIQQTLSWAVAERLQATRQRLLPAGSARWKVWVGATHGALAWKREGRAGLRRAISESIREREGTPGQAGGVNDDHSLTARRATEAVAIAHLRSFLGTGERLAFPNAEHPSVSIVMPTYNKAHYTYGALNSLLANTDVVPFELIVVDNGSTDETPLLLERLDNVRVQQNANNLGFGTACNSGADMARGEYVCFLNNDTTVSPGWLEALHSVLAADRRIGAVGAKLITPDGRLQEAGSILWRDGSAHGYGRGADPLRAEYNYARDVDFCSAACLLVRRTLFAALGGFDERYAPAYYEDADLCLAIWQAGFRVAYQPLAVISHYEFGGEDGSRAIQLQLANRITFVEKWNATLATHDPPLPDRLLTARDRRPGLRVLVIDDRVPLPRFGSGSPRTRALLDALVGLDTVVTFLPMGDIAPHQPATTELQLAGIEVLHSVTNPRAAIEERRGLYDVAVVSRPNNAWCMSVIKESNPNVAVVYDAEAVFALRDVRQARTQGKPIADQIANERIAAEIALTRTADVIVAVTESERRLFEDHGRDVPVFVWGNAVAARQSETRFEARRGLLFVGNLETPPNDDAVFHLITDIFPRIARELDVRLDIVGADPTLIVQKAAVRFGDAIDLPGFVDDLNRYYDASRIFVAPHRFAAGIPLKVVEAMANGIPCVVSRLLGDMLGVQDGQEALVADDAAGFAAKVLHLYRDPELWRRLQEGGWRYVEQRFDPIIAQATLRQCLDAALAHKTGLAAAR